EPVNADPRADLLDLGVQLLLKFGRRNGNIVNAEEAFGTALSELHETGFRHRPRTACPRTLFLESAAYGTGEMGCEADGIMDGAAPGA
ncbi:MAG TPA: hypothetical protein VJ748_06025, partial [Vitreimonas sp.]|nr:hypothetical protein [Vitreimonas sp.]